MKFQNVTDKMAMEFKQIVFMYKINWFMRAENYFHPRVRDQSIGELVNVSKKSVKLVKRALIHAGLHRRKSTSKPNIVP